MKAGGVALGTWIGGGGITGAVAVLAGAAVTAGWAGGAATAAAGLAGAAVTVGAGAGAAAAGAGAGAVADASVLIPV